MTIILDLGGVLMQHNMPACIARFDQLLGKAVREQVMGLLSNGEGRSGSLMEQFELGHIGTETFLYTLLRNAQPGTTIANLTEAWNLMHAGIPMERIRLLHEWHNKHYPLLMLSNNNPIHWKDTQDHYDLSMFDYTMASFEVHVCKPNPQIFAMMQRYIEMHHYTAPYLFVDDLDANRKAGESMGWITFADLATLQHYLELKTRDLISLPY